MKSKLAATLLTTLLFSSTALADTTINFSSETYTFTQDEKALITQIIEQSEQGVRNLLPTLTPDVTVNVVAIDRNIDIVGGVTGRADAPGVIEVMLSTATQGGVSASARQALTSTMYHELHHLVTGWTMTENKYGPMHGIPIATVNEGVSQCFC